MNQLLFCLGLNFALFALLTDVMSGGPDLPKFVPNVAFNGLFKVPSFMLGA